MLSLKNGYRPHTIEYIVTVHAHCYEYYFPFFHEIVLIMHMVTNHSFLYFTLLVFMNMLYRISYKIKRIICGSI